MNRAKTNPFSAAALVAATLVISASAANAQAPRTNRAMNSTNNTSDSALRVTAGSVPGAIEPIMVRAATLYQYAQSRQTTAPGEAKEAYRNAAQAFRQMLATNRSAATAGGNTRVAPPVSSFQVSDDIRTLRASAKASKGAQMEMLNKAASFYATAAKEYFTAQLREALYDNTVGTTAGRPVYTPGRRRPANPNVQGGVVQNPPSVYDQPGAGGNPALVGAPAVGTPVVDPGTTVIAPVVGVGGGVITAPGTVVTPGTVNPPVVTPVPPVTNPNPPTPVVTP